MALNLSVLNNLFDAVYALWLPRNAARRDRLEKQLSGVNVTWHEGVDAANHTLAELQARVTETAGPHCDPLNRAIPAKNLAIWLGQREIRETIRAANQRALVLEDDAWFLPDAGRRMEHYAEEIHSDPIFNDWNLVYFYRENPSNPQDFALYRLWGGSPDYAAGYRSSWPVLPSQAARGGRHHYWTALQSGHGRRQAAYPRELIQRADGSILDHIYRASSERVSTAAYAITPAAVEAMYAETTIWTNDWWLARLTEPRHPLRNTCYCAMPNLVWPRSLDATP